MYSHKCPNVNIIYQNKLIMYPTMYLQTYCTDVKHYVPTLNIIYDINIMYQHETL